MRNPLDELLERLKKAFGEALESVVLYGSAATGELHGDFSDYNVLCVLREITPQQLAAAEPVFHWWREGGSPSPLLMTREELERASDSFPIEFHDIKEQHRILHGPDLVAGITIDDKYYRAQLEYQLRAKLLRLRQKAGGVLSNRELLLRLLAESVSTFCVLTRHALRLAGGTVPFKKREIVEAAVAKFGLAADPFVQLLDVREGKRKPKDVDPLAVLGPYLYQIEEVIRVVDRL